MLFHAHNQFINANLVITIRLSGLGTSRFRISNSIHTSVDHIGYLTHIGNTVCSYQS